jgi:hypothetical protein
VKALPNSEFLREHRLRKGGKQGDCIRGKTAARILLNTYDRWSSKGRKASSEVLKSADERWFRWWMTRILICFLARFKARCWLVASVTGQNPTEDFNGEQGRIKVGCRHFPVAGISSNCLFGGLRKGRQKPVPSKEGCFVEGSHWKLVEEKFDPAWPGGRFFQ